MSGDVIDLSHLGGAPAPVETMWRCAGCGKWSHAKARPRHHERFLQREPYPDEVLVRRDPSTEDGPVVWVRCGPFDEWTATRA